MHTFDKTAERHLLVTVRSRPEHRQYVQQLLLELVDLLRLEPGCLYYHLFQPTQDLDTFLIGAAWVNDEAVATHPSPTQSRLVDLMLPLLTAPMDVQHTRRISENPT